MLGQLLAKSGQVKAAEHAHREAVNIYEKLISEFPNQAAYRQELAGSYFDLAFLLSKSGQPPEAEKAYSMVLTIDPKHANAMNNLSWLLATCAEPRFRHAPRALDMAKKAVEAAPKKGMYWNTLGVAHYRTGEWKSSMAALEKSMELRKGGVSSDWFFLAMAHWKQGDKKEARKWYHQAVLWLEKNAPQDEELRRFRAEAAELMQVAPSRNAHARRRFVFFGCPQA